MVGGGLISPPIIDNTDLLKTSHQGDTAGSLLIRLSNQMKHSSPPRGKRRYHASSASSSLLAAKETVTSNSQGEEEEKEEELPAYFDCPIDSCVNLLPEWQQDQTRGDLPAT